MDHRFDVERCDSCGKSGRLLRECPCNQRDFDKYPKYGFPEGDPRIDQLQRELLL